MSTAYELARDERYPDWHEVARESRRPVPPAKALPSGRDAARYADLLVAVEREMERGAA